MGPTTPPPTAPEAIARRRTTRRFDPARPLSDDLLTQLLGLATFAPSPYNLQPWRFLVVRDEANRRKLRACAFRQPAVGDAPAVVVVLGYHNPERSHLGAVIDTMRALGAATPEESAELRGRAARALAGTRDRAAWASRSAMLATAVLMIAAESLSVASALIEAFDPAAVAEAFGVPDDHTVCGLVALGHAAEAPAFPGRLALADVCYAEHFGQPWKPAAGDAGR